MASSTVVRDFVNSCSSKVMKNAANRKNFAAKLTELTNFYSLDAVHEFVEEMRGLDFYRSEDRAFFSNMFFSWVKEERDESFNA